MQIKEVTNKQDWEGFFADREDKTFLQSWNWGDFNVKMGSKIWRLGAFDGQNMAGVALVIKVSAKRGTFLYIPHGPVFVESLSLADKKEILRLVLEYLHNIAKAENASFIRVCPLLERTQENQNIFEDLGFRQAPMHASAYEATWKMDILPDEVELLKNMRKTTRYLIKKAGENPDISIVKSTDQKDIPVYQKLNREVSKRQKFVPFSNKFIETEFDEFAKDGQVEILLGYYKGQIAAGAMVIFWQGIGFYHQAGSLAKFAKHSVPYLLQWQAIKEAKEHNCHTYDFWGFTDPQKYPKHPWAGPTLFKMGFGGYKKEFIETQDFVISNKYWANYIIEKIRKFIRGL